MHMTLSVLQYLSMRNTEISKQTNSNKRVHSAKNIDLSLQFYCKEKSNKPTYFWKIIRILIWNIILLQEFLFLVSLKSRDD